MLVRALLLSVVVVTSAQAQAYTPPRTPHGAPDLQGTWDNSSITRLQRPKSFKALVATPYEAAAAEKRSSERYDTAVAPLSPNAPAPTDDKVEDDAAQWFDRPPKLARIRGEIRSSWITEPADGRLPYTETARASAEKALKDEEVYDHPEGRPFDERCLLGGGGGLAPPIMNSNLIEIVQTRDHVVLFGELNNEARIIRLDKDRRHLPAGVRLWMGDPVGWWEGDTLVVETTNISPNDRWRWNAGEWIMITPDARIVERFTRVGRDQLIYDYVVEAPGAYTRPWRGEMPLRATKARIHEYACHEGNYALTNILAGGRVKDREAAAAPNPAEAALATTP